jgi:3-dehydroquinate dehydratase I
MPKPRICAVVVDKDLGAIQETGPLVEMFEVRLDMLGPGWAELVKVLPKPWIACNRRPQEGGCWQKGETGRIAELLRAAEIGAALVDIELRTPGLDQIIPLIKQKAQCLISYHDVSGTPGISSLRAIVNDQIKHGADYCKVVTAANSQSDNLTVLQLAREYREKRVISLAMGELGLISRVLSPLAGGYLTYASMSRGAESAPGQITVKELREIYGYFGE